MIQLLPGFSPSNKGVTVQSDFEEIKTIGTARKLTGRFGIERERNRITIGLCQ